MTYLGRLALALVLVVACTGMTSCDRTRGRNNSITTWRTKAEYFKAKQSATNTPFGEIDVTTVVETPDGVEYKTADGKRWKVVMEPYRDGFRLRQPEQIKK